jgi:hypothetical protein
VLPVVLVTGCALSGCSSSPRVATVSDEAWRAAADSPRTPEPTPPPPEKPSVRSAGQPLTRDEVLEVATIHDAQDAIDEIDRHPLSFPLDEENLAWFESRFAPPELVDYLRKRAEVDWTELHGTRDAPGRTYVDVPLAPRVVNARPPRPTLIIVPDGRSSGGYVGGYVDRSPAPGVAPFGAPIPRAPGPAGTYTQTPGQTPQPAGLYGGTPGQPPAPAGLYPSRTQHPTSRPFPVKR